MTYSVVLLQFCKNDGLIQIIEILQNAFLNLRLTVLKLNFGVFACFFVS